MVGALLAVGQGVMGLEEIAARLEVGKAQPPGVLLFGNSLDGRRLANLHVD
jgi:hypothetical protein